MVAPHSYGIRIEPLTGRKRSVDDVDVSSEATSNPRAGAGILRGRGDQDYRAPPVPLRQETGELRLDARIRSCPGRGRSR
jgi:hypothetical protein